MSRELIGPKKSSTLSAKAAYDRLLAGGYAPQLIDSSKPLLSQNWERVITDRNVALSGSGKSVHLVDVSGKGRPAVDLKTKGMMSESSIAYFEKHLGVSMKP